MPEMLRRWRKKKSWRHTLPLARMYASKRRNRKGMSLQAMCGLEKRLTLNRETGFNELAVCKIKPEVDRRFMYLTRPLPRLPSSYTPAKIAAMLVGKMEDYFTDLWDGNRFHLVFCSGGLDSRIMAWVLARLRKKNGRGWLGRVHFRCHEPEGALFKRAMRRMGWKPGEYSVYREGRFRQADYFDIGGFAKPVNGFHNPLAEFWGDLLDMGGERDTVLVTGSGGGELFSYPLFSHWRFTANRYEDFVHNTAPIMVSVHRDYGRWGDLLSPYLGYGYLDTAFRVPKKHFKWVKAECFSTVAPYKSWQRRDLMRMAMLRRFKDDTPLFVGHEYNLRISQGRADYMKRVYQGSKLVRDFGHLHWVKNAEPWKPYLEGTAGDVLKSLDAKLYGYAAMYEGAKR